MAKLIRTYLGGIIQPPLMSGFGCRCNTCVNALHRAIVDSLNPWLRKHARNKGARLLHLPAPRNVDFPIRGADFARLAVAWGLSHPPSEIGKIFPPSKVSNKPLYTAGKGTGLLKDWTERYISKEQV